MPFRALQCYKISPTAEEGIENIVLQTRQSRPLAKGEVRVSMRAAALNFPELLMLQNKYQFKPQLPFTLCTEGAGVIAEVGEGVKGFRPGDKVMVSSMAEGCCQEEWVGKSREVAPLPESLSFSQGAGFSMGYLTGYHALVQRGQLKKGEWLLVTGAGGGMGMAAVQLGKALGARVIAAASSDDKLAACKAAGADFTVNYTTDNLKKAVSKITKGRFCDVIYEPVGGKIFSECVRCVASNGGARLLVVGFASGDIPKFPINMALIKGFDLVGVRMGHQFMVQPKLRDAAIVGLNQLASGGQLKPVVTAEYPIEDAKSAFKLMADRKVVGKCVITMKTGTAKL